MQFATERGSLPRELALYNPGEPRERFVMQVFVFLGKGGICGATKEASGVNLPHISGPWHFLKKTRLSQERGIDPAEALQDIKVRGYYLTTPDHFSRPAGNA